MASPTSSLPPRTPEEQDSRYNPAEQAYREKMGAGYVPSGIDQAEQFANDPNNSTEAARRAEEASDVPTKEGFYRPSRGGKKKVTLKGFFKRRSAVLTLGGIFLGGGGILSLLFTPGLGIIQLKEVLLNDLNDQIAAVDIRSDALWRAKLGDIQSGVCSNAVQIRCKFQTMSNRQIERFKKAGFVIENDGLEDKTFGRKRITSMTAPNGQVITNPQELFNQRRDPQVRTAMNRVFNPLYASMSDSVAGFVFGERFKTSKATKLQGTTIEELDDSLAAATAGEEANGARTVLDEDGRRYVLDGDGTRIFEDENGDKFRSIAGDLAEFDQKIAGIAEGGKAVGSVLGGAIKGVSVLGAADAACTVYNTARAVAAAAKATRSIQLAQYSMVFLTTADEIKAGTATPEQVEYLGNILTATDTRKMITDELSTTSGNTVDQAIDNAQERDNPFYGKNAFDSPGYAVAAYNDAPTLTSRSQQYMVGGGLTGSLSSVTTDIANALQVGPEGIRNTCGVVQSWWVRGAGLAVGVIAAIGSFGVGTAISIGASLAVSFAMPFLEAALADIVAGKVVGPNTKGVDSGDAIFSGSAALMGGVAQARGLKPLTGSELEPYLAQTQSVQNQYIAQARLEAQTTPFDVMNEYSFLGSFARSLNIPFTKASTGASGALAALPQLFSSSLASLTPHANAQQAYNPERFNKCQDEGYDELGIKADVFCNVRYGLTPEDLGRDPIEVVDFMTGGGHITTNGDAASGSYKDYLEYCVNRQDGWGETGEEGQDDWKTGKACMGTTGTIDANTLSYFRVYTIDKSLSDAMDDEQQEQAAPTTPLTERPEGAIDKDRGWTFERGKDYSQYPCDPRTEDMGVFTSPRYNYTMRLCKINFNSSGNDNNGSQRVASVISANVMNMFEAARAAGIELGMTDGMRLDGGSASYYSEHATGLAMDIGAPRGGQTICYGGSSQSGYGSHSAAQRACERIGGLHFKAYQWLNENAATYGFHNYLVEPWHWSTSGS